MKKLLFLLLSCLLFSAAVGYGGARNLVPRLDCKWRWVPGGGIYIYDEPSVARDSVSINKIEIEGSGEALGITFTFVDHHKLVAFITKLTSERDLDFTRLSLPATDKPAQITIMNETNSLRFTGDEVILKYLKKTNVLTYEKNNIPLPMIVDLSRRLNCNLSDLVWGGTPPLHPGLPVRERSNSSPPEFKRIRFIP